MKFGTVRKIEQKSKLYGSPSVGMMAASIILNSHPVGYIGLADLVVTSLLGYYCEDRKRIFVSDLSNQEITAGRPYDRSAIEKRYARGEFDHCDVPFFGRMRKNSHLEEIK